MLNFYVAISMFISCCALGQTLKNMGANELFSSKISKKYQFDEQSFTDSVFINSIGIKMVCIESGEFLMGNDGEIDYSQVALDEIHAPYRGKGAQHPYIKEGPRLSENPLEWDEKPIHRVNITRPFYMSSMPVTNAQYEQFDPQHAKLRGKFGFSKGDDEAVLFVSWHDAVAFTKWLSEKQGQVYRLPTEAEWEYAARAGTSTPYYTGNTLPEKYHQHQVMNRSHTLEPERVNLSVGQNSPNEWGLYDIHGMVEEWCYDWYGPYTAEPKTDPVGSSDGIARVTRGGSHSTGLPFLRCANRSGALPETKSFLIGFRVVMGKHPEKKFLTKSEPPVWAKDVNQERYTISKEVDSKPIFMPPVSYARVPNDANGPIFITHNHCPALTDLPNGDLLAIWFSTVMERGREMVIVGSRFRMNKKEWDQPDVFFKVPDRNMTGSALWWDGDKTIYHFNGISPGDDWKNLIIVERISTDNGVSWTKPKIIASEYGFGHQPIDAVMQTSDGEIVLLCDAVPYGKGGSVVHISRDKGKIWTNLGMNKPQPKFDNGSEGALIAGIHAGVVELKDGRWMAFGRGNNINGRMPQSISEDKGKTWSYSASPFPPIGGAQRLTFLRLKEGPLLLISFTSGHQMDEKVNKTLGSGMFATLSLDEGKSWPIRKFITPGYELILNAPCNHRWGKQYSVLDKHKAEPRGYLTAIQAEDGMIHVLSSGTHYAFNLEWLMENKID